MPDLRSAAEAAARTAPKKEILSFEYQGQRYWLKRGRPTGSNLLHRAVWHLSRFPLLVPVLRQDAAQARAYESDKIRRLGTSGHPVPEILLTTDAWFVMSDTGPVLRDLLYRRERNDARVRQIFEALGALHRSGEYHGGSQLRNLTWSDGKIHFIDFEERFDPAIDRETLQLRDLFLLLFSFAKDRIPMDYPEQISYYRSVSGNDDFDRRLHSLFRHLGWLERTIALPPIWKILDKDTKATYRLIQELKKL